MSILKGLLRLFFWNSKIKLQRGIEFRFDFLAGIFISTISSCLPPLFQYLLFTQTKGYPGWTLDQVILFQGILLIVVGFRNTLFGETRSIVESLVRKGDFDRLLLKPYPPIGILLASGFNISNMGALLAGIVLVCYSAKTFMHSIGFLQIILFLMSILSGLVLYTGILVIYCSINIMVFYLGGIWSLFQNIVNFSNYPKEIYPKFIQGIFITVIPFMIIAYYPTQVLLNRADIKILLTFLSASIFFMISLFYWNYCLKKYVSAGG